MTHRGRPVDAAAELLREGNRRPRVRSPVPPHRDRRIDDVHVAAQHDHRSQTNLGAVVERVLHREQRQPHGREPPSATELNPGRWCTSGVKAEVPGPDGDGDLVRSMLAAFGEALMSAVPYLIVITVEQQETSDLDNVATTDHGQRPPRRRGLRLFLVALTLGVVVFGCSSPKSAVYDATRSAASLQTAAWKAKSAAGMPNTISGVRQEGYLETTAPDGTRIDIQFLEDGARASQELKAVMGQDATFVGATIGNSLVFAADTTKAVPKSDLDALSTLLRS